MLEINYNLFKTKGGYSLTVAVVENDNVIHEDELEEITGLRKNVVIMRKKTVALNDKALTFGLNIFNDTGAVETPVAKKKVIKSSKK